LTGYYHLQKCWYLTVVPLCLLFNFFIYTVPTDLISQFMQIVLALYLPVFSVGEAR